MSDKPHLLIVIDFHSETVAKLDSLYQTHHLWEQSDEGKLEMIESLQGKCQTVATGSWYCDDLVYQLDSLKLISCFGVGVDTIDFEVTSRRNIKVTNTPDILNDAVADIAIALVLATTRRIPQADSFVRNKDWIQGPFPLAQSLAGKTLGIIGLGRIGEAIVHRALPFKLKIAYHNRSPKNLPYSYYPSIIELAAVSDILLCALPGGEATQGLIGDSVFEALGSNGIFINVGRGSSVDEAALVNALEDGTIAGAGLDVYANEPFVPEPLLDMENVVLLPHIGTSTVETRREMGLLVMKNLAAFFTNSPLLTEVNQS